MQSKDLDIIDASASCVAGIPVQVISLNMLMCVDLCEKKSVLLV